VLPGPGHDRRRARRLGVLWLAACLALGGLLGLWFVLEFLVTRS
jgi:hypothetical protein